MLFERLVGENSCEIAELLEQNPRLAHYTLLVFSHSQFLGETLVRNPDLLTTSLRENDLDRVISPDDFQERLEQYKSVGFETDLSTTLAAFKRRQYVRILLRDISIIASLAETTTEISALTDVLLQAALEHAQAQLQRRYGVPQRLNESGMRHDTPFAVIALGKLGGNELNYSSDIDVIFVYGDGSEAPGCSLSHREYFIRLAQEITSILSCATPQGAVFRIDLRLRPQGGEGELAISLAEALRYYASVAEDWELQALIKARHSAGDSALTRAFIRAVRPHVYKETVNFAAIKTALLAREKMHKRRQPRDSKGEPGIDVKIDNGGIRDIEFLVQCLQRVYGGAEPWLQSSGTLFALQKLHDNRHISGSEFHELTTAYEFLRTLEHRLQMRRSRQTHLMPTSGADLSFLQRAMSRFNRAHERHDHFVEFVRQRMATVAEIYHRVIYQQQSRQNREESHAAFQLRPTTEFSVADHSNRHILERLAVDAPELHEIVSRNDLSPTARRNLFRFFTAALTSSERYGAVLRHREAVAKALPIFDTSDYLTQLLTRHPEQIATLADADVMPPRVGSGYLFDSFLSEGRRPDPAFAYVASSAASYSEKLRLLRRHFRHRIFAAGAKDIAQRRDVYTSCAEITSAAEDAIASAFDIADAPPGLAIMALGRLGSGELDLLSDADLLFISEDAKARQKLDQSVSQIVQILSAYTQDGMLFPVDTRLRPRGVEGELLTPPANLARYFEREAQAWEAVTYTKLRFIAGSRSLGQQVFAAVAMLCERFAADQAFQPSIREMRRKLEASDSEQSFKTSSGAIYDIDFLTGFLLVKHRINHKNGSLRDRIWRCADAGLLDKREASVLDHGGELLRTVDHVVRLVLGRRSKCLPTSEQALHAAEKLASDILARTFIHGLQAELESTCAEIRQVYERVVGVAAG
jgi:[glutamine synthetase] adenylyltransferase / [glutamine synthetase]-adenylyl-L-tyrosine phosphorylase